MKTYQISFFDESKRLAALSRLGDPLEQLLKHVDFEIFRPILNEAFRKADRKSPAGRKPLDVILMFKAMVIQRLFNLSDEQLEFRLDKQICGRANGFDGGCAPPNPAPLAAAGVRGELWGR